MAKKASKETSLPLVFALVFFVLTTIAFGVMWYMQYQDQQTKDDAVKKATAERTAAQGEAADAIRKMRIYKIILGVDEAGDKTAIDSETQAKEKIANELKDYQKAAAKAGAIDGVVPPELDIWGVDESGQPKKTPTKNILSVVGNANKLRKEAQDKAAQAAKDYNDFLTTMKKNVADYSKAAADFETMAKEEPKKFAEKLNKEIEKFEKRKDDFTTNEKKSRDEIARLDNERNLLAREAKNYKDELEQLQKEVVATTAKLVEKRDAFQFDEPQGKVLRRLPEGILEINIGSSALVQPGLTFTVLPNDFPEKGRQSRMRVFRVPNERGEYKNVERFVEKATIEVIEVLGPNLSRARITSEHDFIRDGAAPGDLLYNSVWRKGSADRIALVGIFDINGDGTDDIQSVVRDLLRMGIPVDAYFDLSKRQWVGAVNEQTRYIIVGRYPEQTAADPNREDKNKIIEAISKAVQTGREKGIQDVNYRDFFPRMGYRVKVDVPIDRINQATAPYLKGVTAADVPPPGGN
jgi:hypothetical protein